MDDLVVVGDDLHILDHLVVRIDMVGVESFAYIIEGLHIVVDMEFVVVGVDSLVADVDEGLHSKASKASL